MDDVFISQLHLSAIITMQKNLAQYFLQTLNDNSKVVLILFAEFASNLKKQDGC